MLQTEFADDPVTDWPQTPSCILKIQAPSCLAGDSDLDLGEAR